MATPAESLYYVLNALPHRLKYKMNNWEIPHSLPNTNPHCLNCIGYTGLNDRITMYDLRRMWK